MAVIKVKRVRNAKSPQSNNEDLKTVVATFCFYYSQYTFDQALDLPIRTLRRMLKIVRREQAREYLEMSQIARAAQAEKPSEYNKLTKRYEDEANYG